MGEVEVMRAYRVALDPTVAQQQALASHAGANRAAYNYHLAALRDAHRAWSQEVAAATYLDHADLNPIDALAAAKRTVKAAGLARFPTAAESLKAFFKDPALEWRVEVNRYALSSGMRAADTAWKNWLASLTGARAGRPVGYPRFHAKGRTRDSFTLFHNVKKPTIRPDGYRRLVLPAKITGARGGSVRLHGNLRQLARRIEKGTAQIQSVTISRGGRRWYASILARETITVPDRPNRRQRAGGPVGVDLGVHHLAALSTGQTIANPRHLRQAAKRLRRAQQALARTGWWLLDADGQVTGFTRSTPRRGTRKKPTNGRLRAQARVARLHADLAEHRATTLHALTKHLATGHTIVAVEDLNVAGMTTSTRGTLEQPGTNVAAKAGLNKSILDAGFGEFRRQLEYKTTWYGSTLKVADRYSPTSKTCSACGAVRAKLPLTERTYHCPTCGHQADRDINAAVNILAAATGHPTDACGKRESRNADRAHHTPRGAGASTSEDQDPHRAPVTPARERAGRPPAHAGHAPPGASPLVRK